MALSADAKRAFLSESVDRTPVQLLTFEHASFGALRLCSNSSPITSRGNVYTPAPFLDVKLVASQGGQVPAVEFTIGVNDQALVAALRSIPDSPDVTLEIVLAESPDVVQKAVRHLRMEAVDLGLLQVKMQLGLFPLFQVVGPKLAYTPDRAPGVFA